MSSLSSWPFWHILIMPRRRWFSFCTPWFLASQSFWRLEASCKGRKRPVCDTNFRPFSFYDLNYLNWLHTMMAHQWTFAVSRVKDVCICLASSGAFLCSTRGLQFSPWLRVDSDFELPSTWEQAWQAWQMCLELNMCETLWNDQQRFMATVTQMRVLTGEWLPSLGWRS